VAVVDLVEAKARVNITNTQHDGELPGFIAAAERLVAERCGPLETVQLVEDHRAVRGPVLLDVWPVQSVESVTTYPGAVTVPAQDFTTADDGYHLDAAAAAIEYPFGGRNVRVAYTAGRAVLPPDLREAVLELFAHLWRASQNRTGLGQRAVFGGANPDQTAPFPAGFAMPFRVQELLEGEMRPPVIG
jgi:hypothetical protein